MIANLFAAAVAAASTPAAPAQPPPTPPPHERSVIEGQLAQSSRGAASLSAGEADKLYSLYLSRIGQAPLDPGGRDPAASGSDGAPR